MSRETDEQNDVLVKIFRKRVTIFLLSSRSRGKSVSFAGHETQQI